MLESWTEEEIVPRPESEAGPEEIPLVSISEAMGFTNMDSEEFAKAYLPPPEK